ncbi:MAG: hypothetical protein PHU51_02370 [Candidatus Nanoarchaeia archaeon]|nr:hypothetical protein [Candidatus Nanoarchaeia archaeon]
MRNEYEIRKTKAEEINEKISDLTIGLLLVGSVAYNSEAVTSESDLDLVGILDFSKVDFQELYGRLDQNYEPLLVKHAKEGKINCVSVVWDMSEYEIGLHLWDKNAFERIVDLKGYNFIFRRFNFGRNFQSTADVEILKNLKGEGKEVFKHPAEIEGGHVLRFYSFFEDASHIYSGIQMNNLLLDPIIMSEQGKYVSEGMDRFKDNLRRKLKTCYNTSSSEVNLYNSLLPKLQGKITKDLRRKLEKFF